MGVVWSNKIKVFKFNTSDTEHEINVQISDWQKKIEEKEKIIIEDVKISSSDYLLYITILYKI